MKLKICGLSKPDDVTTCIRYKVDYCGFILNFPKSHRFISLEDARSSVAISSILKLGSPEKSKLSFKAMSERVNGATFL